MRGILCHLLLILVPYIVLSALYSTGRLRKLPCVCLVSICHMLYIFMFCMFYMCSSAKVIYCYLRAAVSVVLHLSVLLRIL